MMTLGRAVLLLLAAAAASGCERDRGWVQLRQEDFERGTYQILESGNYCLAEDVTFNPNSLAWMRANVNRRATAYESSDPLPEQFTNAGGEYDTAAYGIGFFAAIAVGATDVVIDLNGHTLEQSVEHALQMRFFALIELGDRPFRGGQGPHSFGTMVPAVRVTVRNGKLGRSSHHGIHGNDAVDVVIEDVVFDGFEVAAVALNNVAGLRMENLKAWSRIDVPVMGTYSGGRFYRPLLNCLVDEGDFTLDVWNGRRMETLTAADVKEALVESQQNVFDDVVTSRGTINSRRHPDDYALYHNPSGVVDGNAYGYLINGLGVAIGAFPSLPVANASTTVHLKDVELNRLWASITEVPALWNEAGTGPVRDSVGAVFQVFYTHPVSGEPVALSSADVSRARYTGNVVTNAQAIVAKAIRSGFFDTTDAPATSCRNTLATFRSTISLTVLDWVEGRIPFLQDLMDELPNTGVVCNGDTMFHVDKGVIGFKMDGGEDVLLEDVTASNVINFGKPGEAELCGYGVDEKSHPGAFLTGYNGADVRAFSFSGSQRVTVDGAKAEGIAAAHGSAIGFDVFGGTNDVQCNNCDVDGVHAGSQAESLSAYTGPNRIPTAACYREADDTSDVVYDSRSRCEDVSAPSPATPSPRPSSPGKGKGQTPSSKGGSSSNKGGSTSGKGGNSSSKGGSKGKNKGKK